MPSTRPAGRERYIIDRDNDCNIIVSHSSVSRKHACLIIDSDGSYSLVDISPDNPTRVYRAGKWRHIQKEEKVSPEDRVRIGDFETTLSELLLQLQDVKSAHSHTRNKLFISYRRLDTEQVAGRIFDFLSARYRAERIFFDTEAIPGAVDFRKRIQTAVNESAVLLAIIGPRWFKPARGTSFLFWRTRPSKADFVETELEAAIGARVPIIPILVMGATMPSAETLAPAIRPIVNLNALSVRAGRDFRPDMDIVTQTIDRYVVAET